MQKTSAESTVEENADAGNFPAKNPPMESSSTGGFSVQVEVAEGGEAVTANGGNARRDDSAPRDVSTSGSRYPVLSRIPEAPGLLADKAAGVADAVAETPETSLFFQEREDETFEFYPWRFGPGYLLTSSGQKRRFRKSFRRFWGAAGLLILALEIALEIMLGEALSFGIEGFLAEMVQEFATVGGLGVLALVGYSIQVRSWVSGRPQVGRRGLLEELRRSAKMETTASLWFGFAAALGFFLGGAALIWKGVMLIGVLLIGGSGSLALKFYYQAWHAGR